jgi:hypothetical protein
MTRLRRAASSSREGAPILIGAARRITVDDLHNLVTTLPAEMKEDRGGRTIGLANSVIVHFLGRDWFEMHIRHDTAEPGSMRLDFSSDQS